MFEDILREVRRSGSDKDGSTRANKVWESDCYDLKLFTVGDRTLTKAEAFLAWAKQHGHDHYQCQLRWSMEERRVENRHRRLLEPAWREKRMRALLDARDDPMRAER